MGCDTEYKTNTKSTETNKKHPLFSLCGNRGCFTLYDLFFLGLVCQAVNEPRGEETQCNAQHKAAQHIGGEVHIQVQPGKGDESRQHQRGDAQLPVLQTERKGCRKSPAQARKFWKKAADAGDVAAWVALGDDAMVQGKGVGAALRAYRKAQKLCAATPDIAYMPQVCLRVAQYETQYISRKQALAQLAEAKQGFLIRQKEGDETARSWLDETERVIRQLLENESG